MARGWMSGAEVGSVLELDSTSVGANSTFESSTTFARSGTRSWRAHKPATILAESAFGSIVLPPVTNPWIAGVMRVDSGNWADGVVREVLQLGAAAGEFALIEVTRSGSDLSLRAGLRNAGGTNFGGAFTVANGVDAWVPFIFSAEFVAGADFATLWAITDDSSSIIGRSGANIDRISADFDSLDFGLTSSDTVAARVYFDDLILDGVNAGHGNFPLAPWNRHLIYVEPESDQGAQQWATVGAGASHAARMADGDDATGNQATGNASANDDYENTAFNAAQGLTNALPSITIPVAMFFARHQLPVASVVQGTWTYRVNVSPNNSDLSFTVPLLGVQRISRTMTTDPGGGAWETTDIDAVRVAPRYANGQGATAGARVNEMWAYFEVCLCSSHSETENETPDEDVRGRVALTDADPVAETASVKGRVDLSDPLTETPDEDVRARVNLSDDTFVETPDEDVKARVALTDPVTDTDTAEVRGRVDLTDPLTETPDEDVRGKVDLSDSVLETPDVAVQHFIDEDDCTGGSAPCLASIISATSSMSGDLSVGASLEATIIASGSMFGALSVGFDAAACLAAIIRAGGGMSGDLTVEHQLPPPSSDRDDCGPVAPAPDFRRRP